MGRATLGLTRIELPILDKGYFPNKDFEDVPDGGSSDCKHVIWDRSSLRPMFGMDRINASQAATLVGHGVFYLDVEGTTKRTAVFGTKFYEDVAGAWTDRTGAVAITDAAANIVQAINHQQGSNKYSIYCNGVNPPWKWTGTGNAAVLGGSPPANFQCMAKYHDTIFGFYDELGYFSDTGDPETWNASKWNVRFDKSVKVAIDHGGKLAVFMDDHIGSVFGYDYLDFTVEESEVSRVGCVGRLAACKAFFGEDYAPVLVTISRDGIYLVDNVFGTKKLLGDNYFDEFNQSNLYKSSIAYSRKDNLIFAALPYADSTECDYVIAINSFTGAFWPCPSIHANYVRAMATMKDDNNNEFVYYVDNNGYAYKFNRATVDYHTGSAVQAIDSRFKTKRFDMKDIHSVRGVDMLADADGDYNVTVSLNMGLTASDGDSGTLSLTGDYDVLDTDFVLDASVLGGSVYVFQLISGLGSYGRYFSLTFTHNTAGETFHIKKAELTVKRRRMGSRDK